MKHQILSITLLLLLPISDLIGQEFSEKNFDQYTTASGLSHNVVNAILQDSAGYVWIATASGLNRYNGSRFIQFHSTRDSLSLVSEDVGGMTWLNKNRIGIYPSGLHVVDTRTGEARNLFIPCRNQQYQYKYNAILRVLGMTKGIFIFYPAPDFISTIKITSWYSGLTTIAKKKFLPRIFSLGSIW
jgi:ligand-binding sensor domain-containing protein